MAKLNDSLMKQLVLISILMTSALSILSQDIKNLSFLERSGVQFNLGAGRPIVYTENNLPRPLVRKDRNSVRARSVQAIGKFSYDLNKFMLAEAGIRFFEFNHQVQSYIPTINDTTLVLFSPHRVYNSLDFPLGVSFKITPYQQAVISILGGGSFTKFWSRDTEAPAFDNLNRSFATSYYLGLRVSTHLSNNWHVILETRFHESLSDLNSSPDFKSKLLAPMSSIGIGYRFQSCE